MRTALVQKYSHSDSERVPCPQLESGLPDGSLRGKRAAMVTFSAYPGDPRPRRAAHALAQEGMSVDLICLADSGSPPTEVSNGIHVRRLRVRHRRGGKLAYVTQYSAFILMSAAILAGRSLRRRYDLVYVNNMPDVLVLSALVPKGLGAKVILDLHDPMPELMTTIFGLGSQSLSVRLIRWLEKWSMARADLVLTVNDACKRIFSSRSCPPEKIGVVMNSPDEQIFRFRPARPRAFPRQGEGHFVIMYHGSLVERNGLDLAIAAVARARARVPHVELRIYGHQSPFLERVMDSVQREGLTSCVRYLGPRTLEELAGEIESCDVGIIPNPRNAFTEINTPTRIFEYLAVGKPVIAPRTPGIEDYFEAGDLVFFEPGNVADLARAIEDVATDPDWACQVAERGQSVYAGHGWRQERQILLQLVSSLLRGVESR